MSEERYKRIIKAIAANPVRKAFIVYMDRASVFVTVVGYAVLLAYLFKTDFSQLIDVVCVTGVGFAGLSLFRTMYNAPRPYEVYDITPLVKKDTQGHSFPSRHVFSIFLVAASIMTVAPIIGLVYMGLGLLLAVLRVVEGLHFPSDVIAGMVIGLSCGCVYFFI